MKELLTQFIKANSASYNKVLWDGIKLTEKGEKVVHTWGKISNCANNEAMITLADGRVFPVTGYSVPAGNLYEVVNFSPEVSMTTEGQPAQKWVVKVEDMKVEEKKLVSPMMLNDLVQEWTNADANLKLTVKAISKERRLLSNFRFLYADSENFFVVGNPTSGGVNENVVFFRKVQFANDAFKDYYTKYEHYVVKEERLSWVTKSNSNN